MGLPAAESNGRFRQAISQRVNADSHSRSARAPSERNESRANDATRQAHARSAAATFFSNAIWHFQVESLICQLNNNERGPNLTQIAILNLSPSQLNVRFASINKGQQTETAMASSTKPVEFTNWLAPTEQQFWFDQFAIRCDQESSDGGQSALNFHQFQAFLGAALYCYLEKFPIGRRVECKRQPKPVRTNNNGKGLADAMNQLHVSDSKAEDNSSEFSKLQEMHLFKKFDLDNNHSIDRNEFTQLCQRWLHQVFKPACALVVVDVQNDFIDGSLALINGPAKQDGADVVPVVNKLIDKFQKHKATIVYTQDWHPQDHVSFHENLHLRRFKLKGGKVQQKNQLELTEDATNGVGHDLTESSSENRKAGREFKYKRLIPKANLFDTVIFEEGQIEQKLWPTHCVRNSWGAQFHPQLKLAPDSIKIQKGTLSHVDAYSAFWDNMRMNETGLRQELAGKRITDLFFCGLATDYCVAASALDATKAGFVTFVVDDACRGIDEQEIEQRKELLQDYGAFIVDSDLVSDYLDLAAGTSGNGDFDFELSDYSLNRTLIKSIIYRKAFC